MKQTSLCCRFHNPNADGLLETYIIQQITAHRVQQLLAAVKREDIMNREDTMKQKDVMKQDGVMKQNGVDKQKDKNGGERSNARISAENSEC